MAANQWRDREREKETNTEGEHAKVRALGY